MCPIPDKTIWLLVVPNNLSKLSLFPLISGEPNTNISFKSNPIDDIGPCFVGISLVDLSLNVKRLSGKLKFFNSRSPTSSSTVAAAADDDDADGAAGGNPKAGI